MFVCSGCFFGFVCVLFVFLVCIYICVYIFGRILIGRGIGRATMEIYDKVGYDVLGFIYISLCQISLGQEGNFFPRDRMIGHVVS